MSRYNKITVFDSGSRGSRAKPKRVHYLSPFDHSHTLCGINLHASNAPWQRKYLPEDSNVPMCQRCLNSATSKRRKFDQYQAQRSSQKQKNF